MPTATAPNVALLSVRRAARLSGVSAHQILSALARGELRAACWNGAPAVYADELASWTPKKTD